MAGKYTKLMRSIWRDPDFIALDSGGQRMYMLLISQPDISTCGVLPLFVERWAKFASDTNADLVRDAVRALETAPNPFVVTDEDTLELWVRSYIKHDDLLSQPNGRTSIRNSMHAVASPLLREQISNYYETLVGTPPEGLPHPKSQQPAAEASTGTSTFTDSSGQQPDGCDEAFSEVIEAIVLLRLQSDKTVRNPARWSNTLRKQLPDEHRARINELMAKFPGAPASSIAAAIVTNETRALAGYAA